MVLVRYTQYLLLGPKTLLERWVSILLDTEQHSTIPVSSTHASNLVRHGAGCTSTTARTAPLGGIIGTFDCLTSFIPNPS